jgi:hypothetical protein
MMRKFQIVLVAVIVTCVGLVRAEETPPVAKPEAAPAPAKVEAKPAANDKQFHPLLLTVAGGYKKYGVVDKANRWAPEFCRRPPDPLHASAAGEKSEHARKLYFLFAADSMTYLKFSMKKIDDDIQKMNPKVVLPGTEAAEQIVVKESWHPEKISDTEKMKLPPVSEAAELNGERFKRGKQSELFIMAKLDKVTAETDEGWIYGTVTPDGKTVTSAGRVQSCMECHKDAPHGRWFGLKSPEKEKEKGK